MLNDTHKYFKELDKEIRNLNKRKEDKDAWNRYISCVNLPNVKSPPELRKFIFRWICEDQQMLDEAKSWVLDINERSTLTQDPDDEDERRRIVRNKQSCRGEKYFRRAQQVLTILNELEEALKSKFKDKAIKDDLIKIKDEIRERLISFMNLFAQEILSNVENGMEIIDAIRSKYSYECELFKTFLWCFRLVPLPPE